MKSGTSILSSAGFTLVEILVASGIVGMVTGLAVPSYNTFTARARQAEAKNALSQVYARQRSYAVDNLTYTACLRRIGVSTEPNNYYAFGFRGSDVDTLTTCGPAGGQSCMTYTWRGNAAVQNCANALIDPQATAYNATLTARRIAGGGAPLATEANLAIINDPSTTVAEPALSSTVGRTAFRAVATGKVSNLTSMFDRWYIDETMNLVNGDVGL